MRVYLANIFTYNVGGGGSKWAQGDENTKKIIFEKNVLGKFLMNFWQTVFCVKIYRRGDQHPFLVHVLGKVSKNMEFLCDSNPTVYKNRLG